MKKQYRGIMILDESKVAIEFLTIEEEKEED